MFSHRPRGLLDFVAAALCLWAAAYHTPVGALARTAGAWAWNRVAQDSLHVRAVTQPLLAYYSGGVYDANPVELPTAPPLLPTAAARAELSVDEAMAYGSYSVWSSLSEPQRRAGRAAAERFHASPDRLVDPVDGPREHRKLLAALAQALGSRDAAVLALFCGVEPARYAAERARAGGAQATLEEMVRVLPPGYSEEVGRASRAMTLGTAYVLSWPVSDGARLTSPFGWRDNPSSTGRQFHPGVDLAVPVGTAVHVTGGGVVRRASEDAVNGRVLVIDHGRGVSTAYCHNSELRAATGEPVERGQIVSLSGNTGRSTGPHLHYQLELGKEPVDPLAFRARRAVAGAEPRPPAGAARPSRALRDAFGRAGTVIEGGSQPRENAPREQGNRQGPTPQTEL